jgi:hypothetical protein
MNDWSRLAVDPKRRKNSGPKNELHKIQMRFPIRRDTGRDYQEA